MKTKNRRWLKPALIGSAIVGAYFLGRGGAEGWLARVKENMENKEYCVKAGSEVIGQGFGLCGGELEKSLLESYNKNPQFSRLKELSEGVEAIDYQKFEAKLGKVKTANGSVNPGEIILEEYITGEGKLPVLYDRAKEKKYGLARKEFMGEEFLELKYLADKKTQEGIKRVWNGFSEMGAGIGENISNYLIKEKEKE